MHPFIDLSFIKIPSYGLLILIGLVVSITLAYFLVKKRKKCFWDFVIISATSFLFAILFSKLLFIFVTFPFSQVDDVIKSILKGEAPSLISGGFVFYGGIIGGLIGSIIGKKIAHCHLSFFLDIYAVIIPLAHSFGRIGCLLAGCCYGIPYEGWGKICYHNPISLVTPDIGIFPVQALESILLFILSMILLFLFYKGKKDLFYIYLISYGFIRFGTEFLRGDIERGTIGIFSVSQIISMVMIFVTVMYLVIRNAMWKKKNDEIFCYCGEKL